tara:strand:- start:10171 stop:11469 length:1299 start_codon:yes stop_codon:yes gene_type:complete
MNNKDKYGEVFTPDYLIYQMIDDVSGIINFHNFNNIFEPGAGKGVFFDVLQNKLNLFNNNFHYTLNEINLLHYNNLCKITDKYKYNTTILLEDLFLLKDLSADLIIGNLPFTSGNKKFVPSLSKNYSSHIINQNIKPKTIWDKMTHYCFNNILQDCGYYFAIIPSMWFKPNRSGIYELFTEIYTIKLLKAFNCKIANKIFNYNCQTPICYVLVEKKYKLPNTRSIFKLFNIDKYIDFELHNKLCIPTNNSHLFKKSIKYIIDNSCDSCFQHLKKISTSNDKCKESIIKLYDKGGLENDDSDKTEILKTYKVITGANWNKKTNKLSLNGFTTTVPSMYYGTPKLILPHKRLARCFKDYTGEYSCHGRDFYVFLCDSKEKIDLLYYLFNLSNIINIVENGFTIRMNFIEKNVFQYIPWLLDYESIDCYNNFMNN